MIVLDTSILIDGISGSGYNPVREQIRERLARGETMLVPTLVLYEWLRGPRTLDEIAAQEAAFPRPEAIDFGIREAELSARLYKAVTRPRTREIDLGIAACAIVRNASLWTANVNDFADIPGLRLERDRRIH
jgi:predicted nucleic acid-binding protein